MIWAGTNLPEATFKSWSRTLESKGAELKYFNLIWVNKPDPIISTRAASTPSRDVPVIRPTTSLDSFTGLSSPSYLRSAELSEVSPLTPEKIEIRRTVGYSPHPSGPSPRWGEGKVTLDLTPSPHWGRGWSAGRRTG